MYFLICNNRKIQLFGCIYCMNPYIKKYAVPIAFAPADPHIVGNVNILNSTFIVNLEHVYRLTDSALTLDDGRELPVSRSRQKEVKRQYIAFIK